MIPNFLDWIFEFSSESQTKKEEEEGKKRFKRALVTFFNFFFLFFLFLSHEIDDKKGLFNSKTDWHYYWRKINAREFPYHSISGKKVKATEKKNLKSVASEREQQTVDRKEE